MTQGWGRWGPDDERGALNLVGAAALVRALACVREHRVLSLGAPIHAGRGLGVVGRPAPQHLMLRDGGDYAAGLPERGGFGFSDDLVTLATHGVTHLDALAHVWQDGLMYNGHPMTEVTSRGARKLGIHTAGPVVTRAVVVDLVPPGQPELPQDARVTSQALQAAVAATGLTLEPGDALLARTGWAAAVRAGRATSSAWPGIDASCGPWLAERDVALLGSDNLGVEAFPSGDPDCQVPLHVALLRGRGVFFCELLDLDALCATGRSDVMLVVAPLNLVGGVGSPVAPVAVL